MVDVAEKRGGLAGQILQRGKVHAVSDAGVNDADRDKAQNARGIVGPGSESACQQHVGQKHRRGGTELQKGAVKAAHIADGAVEEHDRRIKHRRAKAQQDALYMVRFRSRAPGAGDQEHACSGKDDADDPEDGEPLPKEQQARVAAETVVKR